MKSFRHSVFLTLFAALVLAFLFQSGGKVAAEQPVVMGIIQSKSDYYGRLVSLIYDEAFRRIGRKLEINYYPAKRSSLLVKEGEIDGDLARTKSFLQEHPHLIPVTESPLTIRIMAFTNSPTLKISGWQDLKQTGYRVDYLRGSALIEQKLEKGELLAPISLVNDWTLGLRKLFADRSDIFVEFEGGVRFAMTRSEFQGKTLFVAGQLDEFTVHAFLQPEHKELAAKLSLVLKDMRQEGLIAQFEQQAFSSGYAHRNP